MAERKKTGRPSKGPRKRVELKMPIPLAELIEQQARRNGLYVNDWVIAQLAASVDFPLNRQEQLPLNDAEVDAIICECAFCTFPDKPGAAREFARVLKPGGRWA